MKIDQLSDETIIVELSAQDMKNLDITFEEMDYSKVETKRVIWTVLSRARKALGKEPDTSGQLSVEVMRQESGGCVLFFSVNRDDEHRHRSKKYLVKKGEYITCEFESVSTLSACALHLAKSGYMFDSRLYRMKDKYRLLIRPYPGAGRIKLRLPEFCKVIGENSLLTEITDEHWECIAKENAVGLLSSGTEAS